MRKRFCAATWACSLLLTQALLSADSLPRERLLEVLQSLAQQHEKLGDEIKQLRSLLGRDQRVATLKVLEDAKDLDERVQVRIEDGVKAFNEGKYERAKEAFQLAWEEAPESPLTHYNLGLAYYQLDNIPMAKKMFKSTLELKEDIANADLLKEFVTGKLGETGDDPALSGEEKSWRTDIINHQKEIDSYVHSRELSKAARLQATVDALRSMESIASKSPALQKEFLFRIGETYAGLELYGKALEVFRNYEKVMKGEVLPDGYHSRVLQVEEKQKHLDEALAVYLGNEPDPRIRRRLKRNLEELGIFALQMDEFVQNMDFSDSDFTKITERLGEYSWGRRPGRHVMVVNTYEELLFSNLSGTLPLERYQDVDGRRFLREITKLAGKLELKQSEFVELQLKVNGQKVPYLILYTYVPRHDAFIIVRLPKEDLV